MFASSSQPPSSPAIWTSLASSPSHPPHASPGTLVDLMLKGQSIELQWFALILTGSFVLVMPLMWFVCNRVCCRQFPAKYANAGASMRLFVRVWFCMLFACLWLSVQPRQRVSVVALGWEWQLPLYAAIPVVLTFNRQTRRITACLLLEKIGVAIGACLSALVILTVVWVARRSQIWQGVVLSLMQPTFSASCVLLQSARKNLRTGLFHTHILETIIVFDSFTYGSTFSETFTVWKLPVFAFVSYIFGVFVVFMGALFIALPWTVRQKSSGDVPMDENEDVENTPSTITHSKADTRKAAQIFDPIEILAPNVLRNDEERVDNAVGAVGNTPSTITHSKADTRKSAQIFDPIEILAPNVLRNDEERVDNATNNIVLNTKSKVTRVKALSKEDDGHSKMYAKSEHREDSSKTSHSKRDNRGINDWPTPPKRIRNQQASHAHIQTERSSRLRYKR